MKFKTSIYFFFFLFFFTSCQSEFENVEPTYTEITQLQGNSLDTAIEALTLDDKISYVLTEFEKYNQIGEENFSKRDERYLNKLVSQFESILHTEGAVVISQSLQNKFMSNNNINVETSYMGLPCTAVFESNIEGASFLLGVCIGGTGGTGAAGCAVAYVAAVVAAQVSFEICLETTY